MSCKRFLILFFSAAFLMLSGCGTNAFNYEPQIAPPVRTAPREIPRDVPAQRPPEPPRRAATPRPNPQDVPAQRSPEPPRRTVTPRPNIPSRMRSRPPAATVPAAQSTQKTQTTTQPREIAKHETEFNAKDKNRTTNIARAAETINGHIVQPGETFSYNETVGPTNEKRGYKKGTILIKGKKAEGVGGGVCQVSTTLCGAATDAGMDIIERHDHSKPVGYAEEGEEAATSYGGIDFKFKNDKSSPVQINASVDKNKGTISVTLSEV